jgi:peptidoglycan/xylan/chitin deacetylase (PgdA/CDA1 family)
VSLAVNANDLKTTFFVVGSRVLSRPEMVISEYMSGHQISVHTWSHPYLTNLTNAEIVAELGWTMKVIKDTIGVTPRTFRPPYGDIDDRVRAVAAKMGLTPIIWTTGNGVIFDTDDWNIPGGRANGQTSLARFNTILETAEQLDTGFIVLQHDLYQSTVDLAVGYVLPMALNESSPYTLKSLSQCLGWDESESYIETSSNDTVIADPAAQSGGTSLTTPDPPPLLRPAETRPHLVAPLRPPPREDPPLPVRPPAELPLPRPAPETTRTPPLELLDSLLVTLALPLSPPSPLVPWWCSKRLVRKERRWS